MKAQERQAIIQSAAARLAEMPIRDALSALDSVGINYRNLKPASVPAIVQARNGWFVAALREGSDQALFNLKVRLGIDLDSVEPPASVHRSDGSPAPKVGRPGDIFVVHGHNELLREQVVRLLERSTDRNVITLAEQASLGRTIIEKFESHAGGAAYAVVLMTGDDEGRAKGEGKLKPRARQNVILELGYFMGVIGRGRVAVLSDTDVEPPSDIHGLVYIPRRNHWKLDLAKELRDSGIPVDFGKL